MVSVVTLAEAGDEGVSGAEAIFWETAYTSDFASVAERMQFQEKYFGYYLDHEPEHVLLATDPGAVDGTVLGYICGVADTRAHPELYRIAEHIPLFDDLYCEYPAHLHINLTAGSRGKGVGTRLIQEFARRISAAGIAGVHLVTSAGARNVSFYRRAGFTTAVERSLAGVPTPLLFLGKALR